MGAFDDTGTDRGEEPVVVPRALDGERVDRAVALLTGWSRSDVQALLQAGDVLVGGQPTGKSRRLHTGDVVEVLRAPQRPSPVGPEPVPVDVRHADQHVVVVNKPAGLVVHPGAGHPHGTLVQGLLARFPDIAEVGDPARPGIVHRLDRDTSGLLVVARRPPAYEHLVDALARRTVERSYLALVSGIPSARRGVVDAPIGRSTQRRTRMAVRDAGRPARTAFEVVAGWPDADVTLLSCQLETGRTHQIRVHFAAIDHPVAGDPEYGSRGRHGLERQFLHASRLAFAHPTSGDRLEFTSALPEDLLSALERARRSSPQ
jgi:23S rRNA pseudouridine1911/1915/1917 synthase